MGTLSAGMTAPIASRLRPVASCAALAALSVVLFMLSAGPVGVASTAPARWSQAAPSPAEADAGGPRPANAAADDPSSVMAATAAAPSDDASTTTGVAPPRFEPFPPAPLTRDVVNLASYAPIAADRTDALSLKAQVLLDRAGFSPGAIDAKDNPNFRNALAAFQQARGLEETGVLNRPTWDALSATSSEPALGEYVIAAADVQGPFVPDIPERLEEMTRLKRLGYRDARELLAERFHMDVRLLAALNPGAAFDAAGARIVVARVARPFPATSVTRIAVDKPRRLLRAFDKDGRLIASYPVSVGSVDKPTPVGAFTVRRISRYPAWRYNPRFAFKEVTTTRPFRVAPGPNNPLGSAWIGISRPSYGIHGAPDPEGVGAAASHGCVRLTNWDAAALASMVKRGARVEILE